MEFSIKKDNNIITDDDDINVDKTKKNIQINFIQLQKMAFLYNALENGWTIKKKLKQNKQYYIFTKNHEGKKEVYLDNYLKRFMVENLDINQIINENQ